MIHSNYFLYIIILLIILILLNIQENFINQKCSPPYTPQKKCTYKFNGEWSKCPSLSLYPGEKCYSCPWKRPGLDYKSTSHCCHNKCFERKKIKMGDPYYCENSRGSGCFIKYAKNYNNRTCGMRMLYNTPIKPHDTLEECEYSLNKYKNLTKKQCLDKTGAGWCTDYLGEGLCVPGTPLGPNNLIKYYTCFPNQRTNKNSWIYE